MRFQALGPLVVSVDEAPLLLRPAQRRLLAGLLISKDVPLPVDTLIYRMWGDNPPATAHNTLHVHLSALRRKLPDVISVFGSGYVAALDGHEYDAAEFTELSSIAAERLTDGKFREAGELAARAVALWRSDPFPELLDVEDARAERHRLVELLTSTQLVQVRSLNLQGRVSESIAVLRSLVSNHPFNERLWEELILAYYLAGRQADALRSYNEARRNLGEELGVEPGPRLRQLEEKVLLHAPDLDDAAADDTPHNLPVLDSSFIGRASDIAGVSAKLSENHVVTITGAPGIGKTRLALEIGKALRAGFPGGVWMVELAGVRTARDVAATVATTLGAVEGSYDLRLLFSSLASRPALLILDNCEHVLDAVGEFLSNRPLGTRLRLLITSRIRLGVADEMVWPLRPLTLPEEEGDLWASEAVRLFADRILAADPTIDPGSLDPRQLADVCVRTGGMPLAVELTARRVPFLDLKSIEGLGLNRSPVADAIAWSVALLDDESRAAFEAASVFASTFDSEAFNRVCLPRQSASASIDRLVRLVEASLVLADRTSGDQVVYRMLEPIREFGASRLSVQRGRALRDRHAAWFSDVARQVVGGTVTTPDAETLSAIDGSIADYRLAMRHLLDGGKPDLAAEIASNFASYWVIRFQGWEGLAWLEECLANGMDDDHRIDVLCACGQMCFFIGRYQDSAEYYRKAHDLAAALDDRRRQAEALFGWGVVEINRHIAHGRQLLDGAREIFEELGDRGGVASTIYNRALLDAYLGDELSGSGLREAAQVFEELGMTSGESACHRYLSLLAWNHGDESTARNEVERAEELARLSGDRRVLAGALTQVAMVEGRWGDPALAARALLEALEIVAGHQGIYFALASFGALPVLVSLEEWDLAARLLNHIDREHARYGWTPVDRRNAAAPLYRGEISRALAASGIQPDLTAVSTESMSAHLVETLTRIRDEGSARPSRQLKIIG